MARKNLGTAPLGSDDAMTKGAVDALLKALVPTGTMVIFSGPVAPAGWLLCQGQLLARAEYSDLYAVVGTTYGGTATNFAIPNMRSRVPVGFAQSDANFGTLGSMGGASQVTLLESQMPSHTHIQESHSHQQDPHTHVQTNHVHLLPNHSHTVPIRQSVTEVAGYGLVPPGVAQGFTNRAMVQGQADGSGTSTQVSLTTNQAAGNNSTETATNQAFTAVNQSAGGGGAHNNLQPYLTVNYIIKT